MLSSRIVFLLLPQPYLETIQNMTRTAAGFREQLGEFMQARTQNADKKLVIDREKEANEKERISNDKERIALEKRKMELEERKAEREDKKSDALLQAILQMASRNSVRQPSFPH